MSKKRIAINILAPIAVFALLLLVWAYVAYSVDSVYIMPTISSTLDEFKLILESDSFYKSVWGTTRRSLIAFGASTLLAFACMLLCECNLFIKRMVQVIVAILRSIPTMSIIIILIIWTSSEMTPIIVTMLIIFPVIFSAMTAGRENIDKSLQENTSLYKITRAEKIVKVYIPLSAPVTLEGMANAISLGVKVTIASELLAQTKDALGRLMQISRLNFAVAQLFAYTLVAIVVSLILEYAVRLVKKLFFTY